MPREEPTVIGQPTARARRLRKTERTIDASRWLDGTHPHQILHQVMEMGDLLSEHLSALIRNRWSTMESTIMQGVTLRHQGQALPHQPALLPQVAYDGLAQGMELLLHLLLPLTAELGQQALHLLPLQGEQAPLMLTLRLAGRRGQQMGRTLDLAAQARQGTGPLLIGQGLLHPLLQLAQVGEPNPPEQGGAQGQQRHQGEGQQQLATQAGKDSHAQHLGCGRL